MTTELRADRETDAPAKVGEIIAATREAVESGERHWFIAVLEAVGRWPLAEEEVDGRRYSYMVGGEAFDWLLLAKRLCGALEDITPDTEREALLRKGRVPVDVSEEALRRLLGPTKYRAHLNFLYGVQVEDALQRSVTQEVKKERLCRVWENDHIDEEVCSRIYGATRQELFARFQRQRGVAGYDPSSDDANEFTYWLFKHRVNNADPARVASDTRKGLAMLSRLRTGHR